MNLYILRHGLAGERSGRYPDDRKRPLTAEGEKEMFQVAKGMREMKLGFDLILSSPFVRARQTAEIIADVFKSKNLRVSDNLASEADPHNLITELNEDYPLLKNILLVGHKPYLSNLISQLSAGNGRLSLNLKKGGLCKLTVGKLRFGRCAKMKWLITPRQLSLIGKH